MAAGWDEGAVDGLAYFDRYFVQANNLPITLLVAIGLQALPALVLVHLETTLLFEITHGVKVEDLKKRARHRADCPCDCKAH